eukprot:5140824-Pyramimonas_sp.AAC.1
MPHDIPSGDGPVRLGSTISRRDLGIQTRLRPRVRLRDTRVDLTRRDFESIAPQGRRERPKSLG